MATAGSLLGIGLAVTLFAVPAGPEPGTSRHLEAAVRIVREALVAREGYGLLKELCDLGPRLSASAGLERAIGWARGRMEKLNLDRVWLQPVTVQAWERGGPAEAVIEDRAGAVRLSVAALGNSVGTPEAGISGEVLEVGSIEELRRRGAEARSKIVFFNAPIDGGVRLTDESYDRVVVNRMSGPDAAAEAGAAAVLIRSLTTARDDHPRTGVLKYRSKAAPIPAAALSPRAADALAAALERQPRSRLRLRLPCRPLPDRTSHNLIGEIRGREKPEEVIVVAAHLDSWDLAPGAHDDGGGCLQALEVLSLLKRLGLAPKRTIRCVLYADEENGSLGARAYAAFASGSGETHLAAMESDRGVFEPRGFSLTGSEAVLAKVRAWQPLLAPAGIDWVRPGDGGTADVSYITNARAILGLLNDSQTYMDLHHSALDVYEAVNPRAMELGAAAMAILAHVVSEEGL
ncbi:MAG TPA: M20/M25/M40 family metallo-hydrolase [Candidatus Aminicenantes bacterium]|nr:M20/M25/M40 family metallo-hydrolase [Candidatus Aminicenantes bacterium]HRY65846.1 M20/M25/M40 family metallo-hydrolase [Candidatus Aminicenantes bacterium]HRZ72828.1 M20/M25/M40 family metallo-hydrolase [Candidatus Aminicenantes bacterium]